MGSPDSSGRPYRHDSDEDLRQELQQLEKDYEAADHERDRIIGASSGTAAVLEDDEYKSATGRRLRLDSAISEVRAELERRGIL